jgi:UDP-N-acetylmuramoyl-L-alanyl-D-glutamate--2,6-diaminopimelate ligase
MIKRIIKKIIPKALLLLYHKIFAIVANIVYLFPSRKLVVIGVTGTKGKSSTVVMITKILEEAGHKVGSTNTIFFKVGDKEWPNTLKQGMLGRFASQKLLRRMVRNKCTHAVIEVTSEGIVQHRQWGIAFDVVVFTNLGPEHIESHGTYREYRKAKEIIFQKLHKSHRKTFKGEKIKKVIVANYLDKEANKFLRHRADEKWLVNDSCEIDTKQEKKEKYLCADEIKQVDDGTILSVEDHYIHLHLHGVFMAQNALISIAAVRSLGVSVSTCEQALEKIDVLPGRAEIVKSKKGFKAIVDYAHEPKSFVAILDTARTIKGAQKIITVFGVTGGGRDKAKRVDMGKIAAQKSDYIILTTDDPYDDDPNILIEDIVPGIDSVKGWTEKENWWRIVERRDAIKKAIKIARKNDIILLLGKGSEKTMALKNGKMIKWSDIEVVRELLDL